MKGIYDASTWHVTFLSRLWSSIQLFEFPLRLTAYQLASKKSNGAPGERLARALANAYNAASIAAPRLIRVKCWTESAVGGGSVEVFTIHYSGEIVFRPHAGLFQ